MTLMFSIFLNCARAQGLLAKRRSKETRKTGVTGMNWRGLIVILEPLMKS